MKTLREKNKELVKGTLIYAIGSFGSKILSLLIVPLYTFFIVPEELGNYDLILTTINLAIPIMTLQITDAAYKWIVDNFDEKECIMSCTYWILVISSLISAGLCIGLGTKILGLQYAFFLGAMLLVQMWFLSFQRLLRALKKQKIFVAAGIFQTFCFLLSILFLVCVLKNGISGLCWSYIIAHLIAILFMFLKCPVLWIQNIKLEKKYFSEMMKFSIPLIPNAMSWWLINSSDKYIIRFVLGVANNGIYSVSSKFPAVLQTINGLFYASWQDVAIREKAGEERDVFYSKTFESYYQVLFNLVIMLIPLTRIILPLIVSESYKMASMYSGFLYLGMVFQGFSSFYGINYLNNSKTLGATTTSLLAAIINLIVDLILMPYIGLHAAGLSTFVGFFVMWLIRVQQTKEITQIEINKFKFAIWFLAAVGVTIASLFVSVVLCSVIVVLASIMFLFMQRNMILKIMNKFRNNKRGL